MSTHFPVLLVPSATRLKMSMTSSSGRTQKNPNFFHWLRENECAAKMKITKLYPFYFTSSADGGTLAGALYEKTKTKGDHSRSIGKNRERFPETKAVHRPQ